MGDESTTPLVMESIKAPEMVNSGTSGTVARRVPVPQSQLHRLYAVMTIVSQPAGSGWPERHRRRSDLLRTCHRHQVGTARKFLGQNLNKARRDRMKCSGGSADGRVQTPVERIGALAVCTAATSAVREKFSCEQKFS